jgi:hypothetical protein
MNDRKNELLRINGSLGKMSPNLTTEVTKLKVEKRVCSMESLHLNERITEYYFVFYYVEDSNKTVCVNRVCYKNKK